MQEDEYPRKLGKLMTNFHTLELVLRGFLTEYNKTREPIVEIEKIVVGDIVKVNSFTNYDTLGKVINKFNKVVKSRLPEYCVDLTVVNIRDMIAHGRLYSRTQRQPEVSPPRLLKFDKERGGYVKLTNDVSVDLKWLSSNINFVQNQIKKVFFANEKLSLNSEWEYPTKWKNPADSNDTTS